MEDEAKVRSPEEIMKRAICAFLTAQIGCDAEQGVDISGSVKLFSQILKKFGLENELTVDEKRFFDYNGSNKIDESFIAAITWRLEMCMPLFWACGFVDGDLDYPSDVNDTSFMVPIITRESTEDIAKCFGLDVVPIVLRGTIDEGIAYVKSQPMSTIGTAKMEGVVGRPEIDLCDRLGNRLIVKIKVVDFCKK